MSIRRLQDEVNARWAKQLDNPCHQSAGACAIDALKEADD